MATYYWVGGSGTWNNSSKTNWATSSGGAGGNGPPISTDTVNFDANSGTAATVTTASTAAANVVTINKSDINISLSGNVTFGSTLTLTTGTITLNNNTLSCLQFVSNNSNTRTIDFGTGNITLPSTSTGTIISINTATNMNYIGTPLFNCTYSGASNSKVIRVGNTAGGSATTAINVNVTAGTDILNFGGYFNNINLTGFKGTSSLVIAPTVYGDLTFDSGMTYSGTTTLTLAASSGTQTITTNGITVDCPINVNASGATVSFADALTQGATRAFTFTNGTVKLKANATSTVGSFVTSGTNQKYLQSTLAGSRATLSQASGTVSASYLTIKDIAATGGATWNAYRNLNNIDAGNNTGWDFLSTPVTTTTLAMRLGFGL